MPTAAPTEVTQLKEETWGKSLLNLVEHLDSADKMTRDHQVRKWRKQNCYWDSLQYIYWSDLIHDWRTPEQAQDENPDVKIDPALYAKVVNIYRAHGEIIIAAMSASVPKVIFPPDDADNPSDILTAKSYQKLSQLIARQNNAELLMTKALYILYNQGLVCGYNENVESEEYGTVQIPVKTLVNVLDRNYYCPECGYGFGSDRVDASDSLEPQIPEEGEQPAEIAPSEPVESTAADVSSDLSLRTCPECGLQAPPEVEEFPDVEERVTGFDTKFRRREILEFYGPLNVKVPAWIRDIRSSPYLFLETEEHYANMQETFPDYAEFISPASDTERFDRTYRTPTAYIADTPQDLVTVRRCWLRPWSYNALGVKDKADDIAELKRKFPKGVYCVIINDDVLVEALPDELDAHWTLTRNPLTEGIHAEPLGAPVMPMQEITNELANLTLEGVEHNVPETFVDSEALDFEAYEQSESAPGMFYPIKRNPGESLSQAFHEVKGGTLGEGVDRFSQWTERTTQFIAGSLPTVFGGAIEGGSNTAREYELSKTQALQRLSLSWRMITTFWVEIMHKSVLSFADNMIADEKMVEKSGQSFINVWIYQQEMDGTVGSCLPEASENFPVSWAEKRDMLMNLFNMKDPEIGSVLAHPENAGFIQQTLGLADLFVPGTDSREKQLQEIQMLLKSEPMEIPMGPPPGMDPGMNPGMGPQMGPQMPPQMMMISSVPVEPELDDHRVEAETCRTWLRSEVGQYVKRSNPAGYANVMAHMKEHAQLEQQAAMMAAMVGQAPGAEQDQDQVQ